MERRYISSILAFFIAFFTLPMFLAAELSPPRHETFGGSESSFFGQEYSGLSLPPVLYHEELMPRSSAQISAYHRTGRARQPHFWELFGYTAQRLGAAAYILFVVIWLFCIGVYYSRRYVIRFIHDQDGHKDSFFVSM